jgi:hypothetical protein
MIKWVKALFSEDSNVSMVRFMALLSLCFGGYLAIIGKDADVGIFVGAAFAAKVTQKIVETRSTKVIKTEESPQ